MSFRNDRFKYGLATPEDGKELLEIFESGDFKGKISVLFTRRPDPYASFIKEGCDAVIPVIRDRENGRICAVGCCVLRKAYVNGEERNTGYLTGLKVLPQYRKRLPHMAEVYRYLHEATRDRVDIYYTTILKENILAQRMLEKKRKNMPQYRYVGDYTVYCFRTGKKQKPSPYRFERGNADGLREFYEEQLGKSNLSPVDTELWRLGEKDFYTLRDEGGKILAACAAWNQQSYKQYVITAYEGIYKYIKKFPLKAFGYPNLPKENVAVNYASITLLAMREDKMDVAEHFIKKVAEASGDYDFLMLGLFENHAFNKAFDRIRHIKYGSKLYTVHWTEGAPALDCRPINLEVGLL